LFHAIQLLIPPVKVVHRLDRELCQKIIDYLEQHNTLTLATSIGGQPWAASLYYVNDRFNLYFLSKPEARHCQHLRENSAVAATINDDYKNWREIKGVQLEGTAYYVSGTVEKAGAMSLYLIKYPFVKDFISVSRLKEALSSVKIYKIEPSTVWFVDNSAGYFDRKELKISAVNNT